MSEIRWLIERLRDRSSSQGKFDSPPTLILLEAAAKELEEMLSAAPRRDEERHSIPLREAEQDVLDLALRRTARPVQDEELERLYNELLYAVETKWPGESRHETALRYIRERESRPVGQAQQEKK